MYQIGIDDGSYHICALTVQEKLRIRSVVDDTFKKYRDLRSTVNRYVSAEKIELTKHGIDELIYDVAVGFCKFLDERENAADRAQYVKALKRCYTVYFPVILKNVKEWRGKTFVQYEPQVALAIYTINTAYNGLILMDVTNEDFESYYGWETINSLRTMRAALTLITMGDDVHAIALFRGMIEIFSKLAIAPLFKEEYVLFKKYNLYLQLHKVQGEKLPEEMVKLFESEGVATAARENFLAYGWAKTRNGKRIRSMTEFVTRAFYDIGGIDAKECQAYLQVSGEFVHEDYVGVAYDYVSMRKDILNLYVGLLIELKDLVKEYVAPVGSVEPFNEIEYLCKRVENRGGKAF